MVEIRDAIRAYANGEPYAISRIREPKSKGSVWQYGLTFDPPDPMIVMMLGDFVHNLRSALDHVAVACSAQKYRKAASFPIAAKDPFALDAAGEFVDRDGDARKSYLLAIRGMNFTVRAMVAEVQPYGRSPESDVFRILSVLDNADKHREMIAIGSGLRGATLSLSIRGIPHSAHTLGPNDFFYDGAKVFSFTVVNRQLKDSEVDVKCSGATRISIKIARLHTHKGVLDFPLKITMLRALRDVRFVLRQFEKRAIR